MHATSAVKRGAIPAYGITVNADEAAAAERGARELIVAGKRLKVLAIPSAGSPRGTIVMLHEGLGSIALWRDFPALLARRTSFDVIAYSRYGHGWSETLSEPRQAGYMHYEAAVVLPELLDALGIRRPVLLGHSDGASIALMYAGWMARRVRGLIVEAPHVFVEDLSIRSIENAKAALATTSLGPKLARYHADAEKTFRGWNDIWLDPSFRRWNIERSLGTIRAPMLAIQGEDDEYGTSAQVAAIEARVPAFRKIMLPQCGHSPHRDQPEATLAAIERFLDGLPPEHG